MSVINGRVHYGELDHHISAVTWPRGMSYLEAAKSHLHAPPERTQYSHKI